MNLLASEDMRECDGVLGLNLRKDAPVVVTEHVDEEELCDSDSLTDGLRHPMLDGFDMEDVVAELVFGESRWIAAKMIAKEADRSVIGVTSARSLGVQS